MRQISIRGPLSAACLTAVAVLAMPAAAQDDAGKDAYLRYHQAIAVTAKCEEREFNQTEHSHMASYIDQKVNNEIGAGDRLHLIEQAKSNAYELVTKWGCKDPHVTEYTTLFDQELRPIL